MLHSESRSTPLHRTNIYLSEHHRDALFAAAAAQDISLAELIRRFVEKGLKTVKK
jgi:hypothetical protein